MTDWIDLGFSFLDGDIAWRFPIAFQILLCLFIVGTILGLPESPRWYDPQDSFGGEWSIAKQRYRLIYKGRDEEALQVLAALSDLPEDDEKVQSEFQAVRASSSLACISRMH